MAGIARMKIRMVSDQRLYVLRSTMKPRPSLRIQCCFSRMDISKFSVCSLSKEMYQNR
jgi:hypothetical protein